MSFRDPTKLEQITETKISLDYPIQAPANNATQNKTDYSFRNRDDSHFFDWYNGYITIDYIVAKKADGAVIGDVTVAPNTGSFTLINSLKVLNDGRLIYETPSNINYLLFIKSLLENSEDYTETTGQTEFLYYDDTLTEANYKKPSENDGSQSFLKRQKLIAGKKIVQVAIPLSKFGFFQSLRSELLPPMQLQIILNMQLDEKVLNGGTTPNTSGRINIQDMKLWVPMLEFKGEALSSALSNYLKPKTLTFLKEEVTTSGPFSNNSLDWIVSPAISRLKHAFIFLLKPKAAWKNPYSFDTFKTDAGNGSLETAYLQWGTKIKTPTLNQYEKSEIIRMYYNVMRYNYSRQNTRTGTNLSFDKYKEFYPFLYFDFREQEEQVSNGAKTLKLSMNISKTGGGQLEAYACLIRESEIIFQKIGDKIVSMS